MLPNVQERLDVVASCETEVSAFGNQCNYNSLWK